jgi:hypothetical protein
MQFDLTKYRYSFNAVIPLQYLRFELLMSIESKGGHRRVRTLHVASFIHFDTAIAVQKKIIS